MKRGEFVIQFNYVVNLQFISGRIGCSWGWKSLVILEISF